MVKPIHISFVELWIKKGINPVTQLAATLFFALAFIGAAAILQLTVRSYWTEILLALRGELGIKQPARPAPVHAARRRAAA
jgi:hypothetical protein